MRAVKFRRIRWSRSAAVPSMDRRSGTRWVATFLVGALLLSSSGCGLEGRKIDEVVASGICFVFLGGMGVLRVPIASEDNKEYNKNQMTKCRTNLLGDREDASISSLPLAIAGPAAVRGAMQTGETLLAAFAAEGRLPAADFSRVILDVPYGRLAAVGVGAVNVMVSAQVLEAGTFEPVTPLFESMEVTLRSAVQGEVGRVSTELAVEEVGGFVVFEDIAAEPGLEAVLDFSGGAIKDSVLVLGVQAIRPGISASPLEQVPSGPVGSVAWAPGLEPARAPAARAPGRAAVVQGPENFLMSFHRAGGPVKAKKFPKIVLDLTANGASRVDVDAGLMIMTESYETPKKKERPKSIIATLFTVKNGKTKKVDVAKEKVGKDGSAGVFFGQVDVPKDADLRVVIRLKGKKVKNALIVAFGSAV